MSDSKLSLWSFTTVKDEEDIIESFVRYHMNFLDGMVISDNLSNDNTLSILKRLKKEGYNIDILEDKNNYYTIKRINSNSALDVNGASTRPAANVQIYSFNNTCAQQWIITPVDNGQYNILNVCSRLALDVAGGSSVPGTNIHVYTYNNTPAQRWTLE